MDRFKNSDTIKKRMLTRPKLTPAILDCMVQNGADDLKKLIMERHHLSENKAETIVTQAREKNTVRISSNASEQEIRNLAINLFNENKLTPSLVIRALCSGEKTFFEQALSLLTRTPVGAVRRTIYQASDEALSSFIESSGIPRNLFPAVKTALDIIKETNYRDKVRQSAFAEMVFRRLFGQMSSSLGGDIQAESNDIEHLLSMLEA